MGRQAEETARTIVETYDLPLTWQEFNAKCKELAQEMMASVELLPGAYESENPCINGVFSFLSLSISISRS